MAGSIGPGWGRSPPNRFRLTWKAGRWTRCPAWVSSTRDSAKNLWIYNDLLTWCYRYAADPAAFQACAKQRDSRQYHPTVQKNLMRQQWASDVVPKCPVINEASASMDDAGSGKFLGPDAENPCYFKWNSARVHGVRSCQAMGRDRK
ncbi:hypothetical protein EMIT0158MI4_20258 [Burkholderia ambifaria]